MSRKADEFRLKAKEAEEWSKNARDAYTAEEYRDIARAWRRLAEQADRIKL
jgi:hypothetical protein